MYLERKNESKINGNVSDLNEKTKLMKHRNFPIFR